MATNGQPSLALKCFFFVHTPKVVIKNPILFLIVNIVKSLSSNGFTSKNVSNFKVMAFFYDLEEENHVLEPLPAHYGPQREPGQLQFV